MKKFFFLFAFGTVFFYKGYAQGWDDVGGGIGNGGNGDFVDLTVLTGKLYLGGNFTRAGNIYTYGVAYWDGYKYDSLGAGCKVGWGNPNRYVIFNNDLYAGGSFDYMGGIIANHIARWDGSQWHSVNTTNSDDGEIEQMAIYKNELYVAGSFHIIGGKYFNWIARWDGANWKDVGGGLTGALAGVTCMQVYKGNLYVGGEFYYAGGILSPYLACWNGLNWVDMDSNKINGYVGAMVVDTVKDLLYVGGVFNKAGNTSVWLLASWDGTKWERVGTPSFGGVMAMEIYHGELYAGAQEVFGDPQDTVLQRWDGKRWWKISRIHNTIRDMEVYHDSLFITGGMRDIGGMPVSYIASYYSPPDSTGVSIEPEITYKNISSTSNYPNPSPSATHIPYSIPQGEKGILKIYGISGELKASYPLKGGSKIFELPVDEFAPGVYICTITAEGNGTVEYRKMVVVR